MQDIKGKNISLIVPTPFSQHHTRFIRSYIETGARTLRNVHTLHTHDQAHTAYNAYTAHTRMIKPPFTDTGA